MYISINLFRQKSLDEGAGVKKYSVPKILWILKLKMHINYPNIRLVNNFHFLCSIFKNYNLVALG